MKSVRVCRICVSCVLGAFLVMLLLSVAASVYLVLEYYNSKLDMEWKKHKCVYERSIRKISFLENEVDKVEERVRGGKFESTGEQVVVLFNREAELQSLGRRLVNVYNLEDSLNVLKSKGFDNLSGR